MGLYIRESCVLCVLHSFPTRRSSDLLRRRHILAATIGNALEFYDFLTYAFFAIQIGHAFFPSGNAYANLMLSLATDRKSTRLNSSHSSTSYAVFCLKKKRCCKRLCD